MIAALSQLLGAATQAATNVVRKATLFAIGILHMARSKDKKWKIAADPAKIQVPESAQPKRIVFIRHGESEWNEVFNRGFGIGFFVRLVKAIIREAWLLVTRDSVFFDSPLSETGIRQTQDLIRFLQRGPPAGSDPRVAEVIAILRGESDETVVLGTSNLRRAIVTGLVVLWERLRRTRERFYVLSSLQEVTFNIDGLSLLEAGEVPDGSLAKEMGGEVTFSAEFNVGTKGLSSNGYKRMLQFADWAITRDEGTIVVNGHSLYFRAFFQAFLPQNSTHPAKLRKMVNCGVVSFMLVKGSYNGAPAYKILPDSIVEVYGGFEVEKSKKKKNGKKVV